MPDIKKFLTCSHKNQCQLYPGNICGHCTNRISRVLNDHAKLKADLEKAVEGLRHYADENHWDLDAWQRRRTYFRGRCHGYTIAQQTLKEIGKI